MLLFWGWLMIVVMLVYAAFLNYYTVVEEREHKKTISQYKKLMTLYETEISELETLIDK